MLMQISHLCISFLVDEQKTSSIPYSTELVSMVTGMSSFVGNLVSSSLKISFVDLNISVVPSSTKPGSSAFSMTSEFLLSTTKTTKSSKGIETSDQLVSLAAT